MTQDTLAARRPSHPLIKQIAASMDAIFARLDSYTYLQPEDKQDFLWYQRFFSEALLDIDWRINKRHLILQKDSQFGQDKAMLRKHVRAALFIGSFDPFQMTHLAMTLRYLAAARAEAPLVYVVPEGHDNPAKPCKSDYVYRYNLLRMQLEPVFRQLVAPMDLGNGADTIEIIRRFIAMVPGRTLDLTHVLGSDVLPLAAGMLKQDMEIWQAEAENSTVRFNYSMFVLKRDNAPVSPAILEQLDALGIRYVLDQRELLTPSSTDFRKNNAFSIVFPTEEIIKHLEVLFRYRLNKNWNLVEDGKNK
jgi:nicotinic acid mononucleotide adenylyltransferase